jgi:hypothetical protein
MEKNIIHRWEHWSTTKEIPPYFALTGITNEMVKDTTI